MTRVTLVLVSVLPFLHAGVHGRKIISGSWGTNRCLGVTNPANDTPTEIVLCNDASVHVDWNFNQPGDNKSIRLTGTNFCLDAGTNPHNGGPAKLYTCFPDVAAQHWYYTGDNRISITGGDQCLDLNQNTNKPQTYKCTPGNTNQEWTPDFLPTSTTTSAPTATPTTVQYIHPHSAPTKCLNYDGVYDGAFVYVDTCGSTEYPTEFEIRQGDNPAIYVPGTNLCLTTTDGGASRSRLSVSYCRTDQNTHFYYTPDQRLAVTGGTTCLDFGDDITPGYATPLEFLPCKTGDTNQIFTLEDVKATVTTTEAFPDPTTICHIGNQQILKPIAGANITSQYPSGKVPFQYCSAEYFETSSFNITVYLASATSKDPTKDGVVVGKSSNGGSEYDITLSIPKGTKTVAKSQLFVLEYIGGFVAGPTTTYSEPVSF